MKHPIPVVYIITKLELGGAQKVCLSLLNGLEDDMHTMLISGTDGPLVQKVQQKKNIFLLHSLTREVGLRGIINEFRCFVDLIKQLRTLRKQHPDLIVHTHSTKAGILGRWAALFAGIKRRMHTIHGYSFHDHQPWLIRSLIMAVEWCTSLITTHFVCVSSYDAKVGNQLFPRFAQKHTIIRAAVDWEQFYIPARRCDFPDEQPFVFGTIACFKKQKNMFDMLKAFAYTHKQYPQARLEIIGDGALRHAIEQWITDHALQEVITLHGWQHTVAPIMLNWHAFVLSSLWEGLPCAVVEARLLKLPVISYATGGIPDVIKDQVNGLLVEQKDWQALAQSMLTLASQKSYHQRLSNHHDELQDFNDTQMIALHKELYHKLSQKKREKHV